MITDGRAAGSSTRRIVAILVLPTAYEASRTWLGIACRPSREASYAIGKTKITTIRRVLLPAARPSVIAGTMLSTAHVIGDTAIHQKCGDTHRSAMMTRCLAPTVVANARTSCTGS